MTAQTAPRAGRRSGWTVASRRLEPYLDPAVGVLAAGLALTSLLAADPGSIDQRLEDPDVIAVVATVAAGGALAWRRSRPVPSYAVMLAGCLVVSLSDHYIGLLSVLFLVSLFSLSAHGGRRDGLIGLGVGVVSFVVLALLDVPDLGTSVLLQSLALLVAAWALGDAARSRREQQREQERELVEAAVSDERLRIARELHDVVAHSMSLIAVQAGVGAHVIRTDAAAAEQSLEVIAETSRRALEQTRSMLGMLRDTAEDGARPPTQGLGDLAGLVDDVRATGLEVRLSLPAPLPDLDAAASHAAYRIVQESLTNIVKHSAARTATVTLTATASGLAIEVTDPGPARPGPGPGSGHGLLGLRERVRLLDGALDAGPLGSGYRVRVDLPARVSR
ncbi:sensor histidine kinase [Nocardioides sp. URHA0020]|uniref:sensor histidine kinase n=1 Tax=Nocardioides sp. URHA0020 TaxID=1380392 RepID=UPI0006851A8B|nr:histidine kinase [Nocardioides sp. URHA0020]